MAILDLKIPNAAQSGVTSQCIFTYSKSKLNLLQGNVKCVCLHPTQYLLVDFWEEYSVSDVADTTWPSVSVPDHQSNGESSNPT